MSTQSTDAELISFVQFGNYDGIQETIVNGSLTATVCNNLWLLHWAAINNRVRIAKLLISCGASINLPVGELNEIPLQWVARNDAFTYMMELLLEHGADMSLKNVNGHDALSVACIFGNINMAYIM